MIRGAAKNHNDVAIVVDPEDYASILQELQANASELSHDTRFNLALKSFEHTANYDTAISQYLAKINQQTFPETLNLQFNKIQSMRYGENPHQNAAFYKEKRHYRDQFQPLNNYREKSYPIIILRIPMRH